VASPSIDRARRSMRASSIALFGVFALVGLARRSPALPAHDSVAWALQAGQMIEPAASGRDPRLLIGRASAWLAAALYLASRGPQVSGYTTSAADARRSGPTGCALLDGPLV